MPRFDPPHYLMEHDGLRAREAQHALVNARGHYLGAMSPLVAAAGRLTAAQIAPTLKSLSAEQKKQAIKNNKSKIVAELNAKGIRNITVNNDGTLHLVDFASNIDASLRSLLNTPAVSLVFDQTTKTTKPGPSKKIGDVIDALPVLNADQKRSLKQTPFTTFLNAFNPVLGLLNNPQDGVLVEVMRTQGKIYNLSTFPFNVSGAARVDISLVQDGDELFDEPSRASLLRMRTLTAFVVLYFRKWAELHAALFRKGINLVFGTEDVGLERVGQGGDGSSFDKPRAVTQMPTVWHPGKDRRSIPKGPYLIAKYATGTSAMLPKERDLADVTKLVWEIPQVNPKNQQRSFIQLTQNSWDSWRRQHKGLIDARLSEGRPINGLSGLGATGAEEFAAFVAAIQAFCVAVGPGVTTAIVIGIFLAVTFTVGITATIILAAMGKDFSFFVDVKEGKAGASTKDEAPSPPDSQPPIFSPPSGEGSLQTQSAGGVSPALVLGGLVVAALLFRKANA